MNFAMLSLHTSGQVAVHKSKWCFLSSAIVTNDTSCHKLPNISEADGTFQLTLILDK